MKTILLIDKNRKVNEYEIIHKFNQNKLKGQYIIRKGCHEYFLKYYFKNDNTSRFLLENEIKKITQLNDSKHFSEIVDFRIDDDFCYLLEKKISGLSLKEIKDLSDERKYKIILRFLETVKLLHSKGIIHCDIKPSNIIVDDYSIKIIDFEISKFVQEESNISNRFGSLIYASPEQIKKEKLDIQTDIYSIGIIISELILGKTGFENLKRNDVIKKKLSNFVTEEELNELKTNSFLLYIIKKCTCTNKELRYNNMHDLKIDLSKLKEVEKC